MIINNLLKREPEEQFKANHNAVVKMRIKMMKMSKSIWMLRFFDQEKLDSKRSKGICEGDKEREAKCINI